MYPFNNNELSEQFKCDKFDIYTFYRYLTYKEHLKKIIIVLRVQHIDLEDVFRFSHVRHDDNNESLLLTGCLYFNTMPPFHASDNSV